MKKRKYCIMVAVLLLVFAVIFVVFIRGNGNQQENVEVAASISNRGIDSQNRSDASNEAVKSGGNGISDKIDELDINKIVAYINDEPVYGGEVIFMHYMEEMYYQKFLDSGEKNEALMNYLKGYAEASLEGTVRLIARQRAIINEGQKLNYNISDEEILINQKAEKRELTELSGNEEQRQAMCEKYAEMYKKLNMSEEDCNQKYNYTRIKGTVLSSYLIDAYTNQYYEVHDINVDNDYLGICLAYYDSLTDKMNINILQ